ncbi:MULTISPECIES: ATP-binding protein [Streptomyces]|uniref:ATP-binding protein n=2 Tax=Streptomyces TaxID=1883 RepID=A0ABV9IYL8_9ACTN
MDIDPTQPWGIAIDYAGRATVTEAGHTIHVNVYDTSDSSVLTPDPVTGIYPPVQVSATFSEAGAGGAVLYARGDLLIGPVGTDPVVPDPTAVQRAVAAALADFRSRVTAYAALCAAWPAEEPEEPEEGEPEEGDTSG